MSTAPLEFLLDKLTSGDVAAAEQVFLAYEPCLRQAVHRLLSASMRAKFDSVDVVQSVWADRLHGFRDADWRFADVAYLRAFLVKATRNRFLARVRRNQRAATAEQPIDWSSAQQRADSGARPSESAQANELWEQMLDLCGEAHRPLLHLKRQGCALAEIAAKTGYHPSSIRRIFYDLARQLAARKEARR